MSTEADRVSRVAAIVPAFNEDETLADVLSVLKKTALLDEIVVVSDGSTDRTAEVARTLGMQTVELRENRGKGAALAAGVARTSAPVLVFVDADLLNLTEYLLSTLIEPVLVRSSDMHVGVRNRGSVLNGLLRTFGPLLSGVRCLRREVFEAVPEAYLTQGYAIETCLNWTCRRLGGRCTTVVLCDLEHRVKERKQGFASGLRSRLAMFGQVLGVYLSLRLRRPRLRATRGSRRFHLTETERAER